MGKLDQALILHPPTELAFKAPYTGTSASYLKLSNPTENFICFKLKTTAPRMYCVRPNSGIIAPGDSLTVAVMMQAADFESTDKSKHKFMVQSLFAPNADVDQDQLFKDTLPENFMNSKLRCVFGDPPAANTQTSENGSGDGGDTNLNLSEAQIDNSSATGLTHSSSSSKAQESDEEAQKAQEENKKLKALLTSLRQENSQLKEEGLRSRISKKSGLTTDSSPQTRHQFIMNEDKPIFNTKFYVIAVFVFIIGIIVGHMQLV